MKLLLTMIILGVVGCKLCDKGSKDQVVQCLQEMPSENLFAYAPTRLYLQKHKVYVSYTTSPERLRDSIWMLRTLDLLYVEKIFLAIPKLYRNKDPYPEIPPEILNFPKLEVIAQDQEDLGPIMKILPAIEKVRPLDPDAIVISVDDDIGYQKGTFGQLIKYAVLYPDAIIAAAASYAELFGIKPYEWPHDDMTRKAPYCGNIGLSYCNIVEGYRGIAYKPRLFNSNKMAEMTRSSKSCRTSDDLVISYVLALDKIPRIRIANDFVYDVHRFDFGEDGNALHKAPKSKADNWNPNWSWEAMIASTTHSERYQRCVYEYKLKVK